VILLILIVWHLHRRRHAVSDSQNKRLDDEETDIRKWGARLIVVFFALTLLRAGCNGLEGCNEARIAHPDSAEAALARGHAALVEPTSDFLDSLWAITLIL
jgi:hypothetical protein